MDDARFAEVERYLTGVLVREDAALSAAAATPDVPPHAVAPAQGKLLYLLALVCRARTVLEVGTLAGYSTIWLARAVGESGRVVTIEADPARAELARRNLAAAGVGAVAEVRTGAALDVLPRIAEAGLPPFDLVFLDADKPNNPHYLEWALKMTAPGSVLVADNVVRDGTVADAASDDPSVRGIRAFLEMVAAEPRLEATAIQTIGSKGHDGFALAVVTS